LFVPPPAKDLFGPNGKDFYQTGPSDARLPIKMTWQAGSLSLKGLT
jgi:hypothetical protein